MCTAAAIVVRSCSRLMHWLCVLRLLNCASDRVCFANPAGAAGLKVLEVPEQSESKATAESPVSAHTKVGLENPCCCFTAHVLRLALLCKLLYYHE